MQFGNFLLAKHQYTPASLPLVLALFQLYVPSSRYPSSCKECFVTYRRGFAVIYHRCNKIATLTIKCDVVKCSIHFPRISVSGEVHIAEAVVACSVSKIASRSQLKEAT